MAPKYDYPKSKSRFDENGVEWHQLPTKKAPSTHVKAWRQVRQALEECNKRNGY